MVACQQDVPDTLFLQKLLEWLVTLRVVNHHVLGIHLDRLGDRNRQVPKARLVKLGSSVKSGKLTEIIQGRSIRRNCDLLGKRLALIGKALELAL